MVENLSNYFYIFILSLLPGFEGRYALLTGPLLGVDIYKSFLIASVATIFLAIIIPLMFPSVDKFFSNTKLGFLNKLYSIYIMRVRRKVKSKENFTLVSLAFFVAIPFPLTGIWTGSALSYVLGLGRKSIIPLLIGGLISNILTFTFRHLYELAF